MADYFNHYYCNENLLYFTAATGSLLILFLSFKFINYIYDCFRLYIWYQTFNKETNIRERYGEWVIITGATSGIGLSMAHEFARRGFSIIVIGRNNEKLARTKQQLLLDEEKNVGEIITIKIDLSDSSLENFNRIKNEIDPDNRNIGILINNAGLLSSIFARFYRHDIKIMHDMVNVHILATIHLTHMCLPGMINRGKGLILNVSSLYALIPSPYAGVYGLTKQFVSSFSQNLQLELSSHPIDVIDLPLGHILTDSFTSMLNNPRAFFFAPTSDKLARILLNAIGTRCKSICGTLNLTLYYQLLKLIGLLKLYPLVYFIMRRFIVKNYQVSPIMKRREFRILKKTFN